MTRDEAKQILIDHNITISGIRNPTDASLDITTAIDVAIQALSESSTIKPYPEYGDSVAGEAKNVLSEFTWEEGNEPFVDMYRGTTDNILKAMERYATIRTAQVREERDHYTALAGDYSIRCNELEAKVKELEGEITKMQEKYDVVFIGEFNNGDIVNLIPIEKSSIPALIDALQKEMEA